jgi:transcriptional regulator with PAS, ATPase and Fis domain
MEIQAIKQRFGIIGSYPLLDRAIDIARQVAPTDLTVLITGESGTGKEVFPQIIHQLSSRKHGPYIAVNCGAIPDGTIDSELFGHEKGSFTGAHEARKGYFEVVNGGTIFLDEVAELPFSTQVRLLRVLESGEFMRVGSSKTVKTDVRVIAATNINMPEAVQSGKFREDLYYRLNTVPIAVPPLRDRKDDIILLFRKFASDFAEKYRMPVIQLTDESQELLKNYRWPGNVRQLKNITEQISIIEKDRIVTLETLDRYLPNIQANKLPILFKGQQEQSEISERDILYKVLFDMRKDINELRAMVLGMVNDGGSGSKLNESSSQLLQQLNKDYEPVYTKNEPYRIDNDEDETIEDTEVLDESLSLLDREKELIIKALEKYRGKRKNAAKELGISERTLYRKIKEYDIDL